MIIPGCRMQTRRERSELSEPVLTPLAGPRELVPRCPFTNGNSPLVGKESAFWTGNLYGVDCILLR